jgi:hypothetical protein
MLRVLCVAVLSVACFSSCNKSNSYQAYVSDPLLYCKTVKQLNDVILGNNFPPMIASRNYAYATVAAYEVVAAFDSRFQSLAGQIRHLAPLPKFDTTNVDYHIAALLAFCKAGEAVTFPQGSMEDYVGSIVDQMESAGVPAARLKASRAFADSVGVYIMKWSSKDNYLQLRTATKYAVTSEEGRWIPTPPMYSQAIEPHWMEIRPFILDSATQFRAAPPPVYNMKDTNSEYCRALMEVKNIGDSLTEEQKNIAEFWDDNPFKMNISGHVMFATKKFSPCGHWMNIVGIAAQKSNADFSTTVAAYAQTAIAIYDAFVGCWAEKFRYNYVRPETVINKYVSPGWEPYIQTPPFPSYTSGHATISAAAAESMTYWFGDSLSFSDTSSLEFGIKSRQITSFRAAAREAALSRLYGGIHYRFDNESGNEAGKRLGEFIVSRLKMKKN